MRKQSLNKNKNFIGILFLAPSLIGFLIFFLIPFFGGLYYAMVDSPINGSFVGLENFKNLLVNESFLKASSNTAVFTMTSVPLILVLSLGLAILLNQKISHSNIFRTIFIIPLVVPVASVVFVWQCMFDYNGWLNGLLSSVGWMPMDWMKKDLARGVVIIVYIWKNIGYNMVLFLAGLQNIPKEYYESAEIDGAGTWRKFRSITLIYLTPTTFFVFVMSIINSFKVFRDTYLIAGEYPHDSIYMLQHYMNNMFASLDYQKLTSAAFVMAAVISMLVYVLFSVERRINRAFN